jgi:hypothetical protein
VPKTAKMHKWESAVKRCRNWWQPFGKLIRRILGDGIHTKKIFRTDQCVFIGNGKPFTIDNKTMQLLSDLDSNKVPFNQEAYSLPKMSTFFCTTIGFLDNFSIKIPFVFLIRYMVGINVHSVKRENIFQERL